MLTANSACDLASPILRETKNIVIDGVVATVWKDETTKTLHITDFDILKGDKSYVEN